MSQSLLSDPNEVTIVVGTTMLSGWQDVRVTRSIERFPSSFALQLTERYPDQPTQIVINPGDPVQILLGGDPVLTGYVDEYFANITPSEHTVRIIGRSTCLDLLGLLGRRGALPAEQQNAGHFGTDLGETVWGHCLRA